MIDPESQRVLELARSARTPSQANKAAVERRLAAALGLWAGAGAATAAAASTGKAGASKLALSGALNWWLAGAVVVGAGAASYAVVSSGDVLQKRVPAARIEHASAPPVHDAQPSDQPGPLSAGRQQKQVEPEAAAAVVARRAPEPHVRTAARGEHARAKSPAAQAGELDLLHRAQTAWRAGQARAAIALLDRHRARFPRSALRSEGDALRALSLCELGRRAEAAQLARRVIAREPQSPLRAALEQSCALK
jgi:hypothetical protein